MNYDDGEKESRVEARLIRSKEGGSASSDKLREGDKVEAKYRGREKYYPGKIDRERSDGTYDIAYDDGERESRVEARLIRKRGGSDSFGEGDKVEADYRGRGKFYPGKITRDRGDDTYQRPRRNLESLRPPFAAVAASAEYPRPRRGVAATRLHGISPQVRYRLR